MASFGFINTFLSGLYHERESKMNTSVSKRPNFFLRVAGNLMFLVAVADLMGIQKPKNLGLKILLALSGATALILSLIWAFQHVSVSVN